MKHDKHYCKHLWPGNNSELLKKKTDHFINQSCASFHRDEKITKGLIIFNPLIIAWHVMMRDMKVVSK